jgi:hypothetical protein
MDGIFPFDKISDDANLGELGYKTQKELFNHLLYDLANEGKVPFGDMVESIRIDEDEKVLYVTTPRGSRIKATYDHIRLFDTDKVSVPTFNVPGVEKYRVFDWYNVRSGSKHVMTSVKRFISIFLTELQATQRKDLKIWLLNQS